MSIAMRKNKRKLYSTGRHACCVIKGLSYEGFSDAVKARIGLLRAKYPPVTYEKLQCC